MRNPINSTRGRLPLRDRLELERLVDDALDDGVATHALRANAHDLGTAVR